MTLQARQVVAGALLTLSAVYASASSIDAAVDKGVQRAVNAQNAQQRIDTLDDSVRDLERDYRRILKEVEGLQVYVNQLDKQLDGQQQELERIRASMHQVALIERQITPLMLNMVDALAQFVEADIPFEKESRLNRVKNLKAMMDRSDIETAEKYRQVMDAYQDEMSYGRTIKTYRATLAVDGTEKEVDYLRVGRISLVYQSLDGQHLGVWNNQARQWEPLDSAYRGKVTAALRIAREQAAPDLIKVPVNAPVSYVGEMK